MKEYLSDVDLAGRNSTNRNWKFRLSDSKTGY
jgi:hypothetical protein